jgi:hypothetical protein
VTIERPKVVVVGFQVRLRTWSKKPPRELIGERAVSRTYTVRQAADQLAAMMCAAGVDAYVHPVEKVEGGKDRAKPKKIIFPK